MGWAAFTLYNPIPAPCVDYVLCLYFLKVNVPGDDETRLMVSFFFLSVNLQLPLTCLWNYYSRPASL